MDTVRLGKTELYASSTGFGALPIQRTEEKEAIRILRAAYEGGINFFDTANAYTDSEYKLGLALSDVREELIIATKTGAADADTAREHLKKSFRNLRTDYIDIVQLHNIKCLPDPNDKNSAYAALLEYKEKGYIGHIGATSHSLDVATAAARSGLFETIQFPFSYISSKADIALADLCSDLDIGFIAMKGLAGGMLTDTRLIYAFARLHANVLPIWGIQRMEELEEWLSFEKDPPKFTVEMAEKIERDRKELAGEFCRACGYCLPCSAGIDIPTAARMKTLLRRSPWQTYVNPEFYDKMHKIDSCIDCGLCMSRCPYGLDTPALLRAMLADYDEFYKAHI